MNKPVGKTCGECMLCCKLPVIPSLKKAAGQWCSHARMGAGCSIYDARPQECRDFNCGWLTDPAMGPEWKPTKAKLYWAIRGGGNLVVMVDPSSPQAWRKPEYLDWFRKVGARLLEHGNFVLVVVGSRAFVVLPHKELETRLPPEGYSLTLKALQNGVAVDFEVVAVADP